MKATFFRTQSEFGEWLAENYDSTDVLLVGFYHKRTGKPSITYPEAVDEALCYGWIDGVRRNIDEISYSVRFTPRRPKSIWSLVNIRRAGELMKSGRMKAPGLAAFGKRDEDESKRRYSYEARNPSLKAAYIRRMKANPAAWKFWEAQPPSYRRTIRHWIMSASQEETQLRRLDRLIEACQQQKRL